MNSSPPCRDSGHGPREDEKAASVPHVPAGGWAKARRALRVGLQTCCTALERAEERIIESFRPPPGGG